MCGIPNGWPGIGIHSLLYVRIFPCLSIFLSCSLVNVPGFGFTVGILSRVVLSFSPSYSTFCCCYCCRGEITEWLQDTLPLRGLNYRITSLPWTLAIIHYLHFWQRMRIEEWNSAVKTGRQTNSSSSTINKCLWIWHNSVEVAVNSIPILFPWLILLTRSLKNKNSTPKSF